MATLEGEAGFIFHHGTVDLLGIKVHHTHGVANDFIDMNFFKLGLHWRDTASRSG